MSKANKKYLTQMSLKHPNAPTIFRPVTPFHRRVRSSAFVSAMYYSECSLAGIGAADADRAMSQSKNWYQDWWQQGRFMQEKTENHVVKRRINNDNANSSTRQRRTCETQKDPPEAIHIIPEDSITMLKQRLLYDLNIHEGDVANASFLRHLDALSELYRSSSFESSPDGVWVNLNKPDFQECLGQNADGEFMYTLGRMSFDMFPQGQLKCSVKGTFNIINREEVDKKRVILPKSFKEEELDKIMSYNISVAFNIEDTGHEGVLTNYGYMLPDSIIPNRYSIWFTRGVLGQDPSSKGSSVPSQDWKEVFGKCSSRQLEEQAKVLAARVLLGASIPENVDEDGNMEYILTRPIRGYFDVLFSDETLRIIKGHHGSIYVLYRIS